MSDSCKSVIISFKYGLNLLIYSLIDRFFSIISTFIFDIIVTIKITDSYWFVTILISISKRVISNYFIFFFFFLKKKISFFFYYLVFLFFFDFFLKKRFLMFWIIWLFDSFSIFGLLNFSLLPLAILLAFLIINTYRFEKKSN